MFLLDTDHVSILQRPTQPQYDRMRVRMARFPQTAFFISIVSFHEQTGGWSAYLNRAQDASGVVRAYQMLERILSDFAVAQVAAFDVAAAAGVDSLRAQRVRIGTLDLRIAATAITRGFTLLPRNLSDFRQVPSLRVEDWTT